MRNRRLYGGVLCGLASVLLWSASAVAFEPITTCTTPGMTHYETSVHCDPGELPLEVRWDQRCVTYMINKRGAQDVESFEFLKSAIKSSFITWNQPPCGGIQFRYGGLSCAERTGAPRSATGRFVRPSEDDANLIIWREKTWDKATAIVAHTALTYDPNTGVIYNADVEFNAVNHVFDLVEPGEEQDPGWVPEGGSGPYDVQNILTHEIGHFLGLHHEVTIAEATMFPTGEAFEVSKRDLDQDDVTGLCYLYDEQERDAMCVGVSVAEEDQCEGKIDLTGRIGCTTLAGPEPAAPALPVTLWFGLFGALGICGVASVVGRRRD